MDKNAVLKGLTDEEVRINREKFGANILTPPEKTPLWKQFLEKFSDPLIIILLVAGILSICISCYEFFGQNQTFSVFFEPVGIFVAILLATGLAFIFELKADKEFSILNQVNDDEPVKVIRNGHTIEIPKKDVVVQDIVIIETGCEIPADGELIDAVTLTVDESTLTGEVSCAKTTDEVEFDKDATYPSNHVMKGTKVLEGHGIMKVFAVGDKTENGKVFEEAQIDDSVKTPLNEQLDGLGDLITNVSYAFAAVIIVGKLLLYFDWAPIAWTLLLPVVVFFYLVIKKFESFSTSACIASIVGFGVVFIAMVIGIFNILTPDQDFSHLLSYTLQTLMIAVTLVVVAVPEGLPMAVTLSLAYSMRRMLQSNNLVRKMHACETMGATTVICTDKTGTLTQNKMTVSSTSFFGLTDQVLAKNDEMSTLIVEGISVNSTAALDGDKVVGNPTEGALLLWLKKHGINYSEIKSSASRIAELPFTTERKYMASVVHSTALNKDILYVKGAPEIVYSLSKNVCNDITKDAISNKLLDYQNQGMRTLVFAYQILSKPDEEVIKDQKVVADNLTFAGIVAISDPVRDDVPDAVKECLDAGIKVKIVTGDTPATAREIGRKIGLWTDQDNDRNIITGPEFAALSEIELSERIDDLKIISRARPMDKKRLVETLQKKNEVVAVTGDGTNDAPALNAAHVGLSMGDGTSVAKEASDITIIDNSFSSIGRAVMWGRSLFMNIQRFILFQMTVNVAACFIVLAGAFMGTESPLTVTQMLWVNLIMDTFAAMALASLPPSEAVMKDRPRDRNAFIINKPMSWVIVGVGGIFFLLLLALLYVFEHADITSMADLLNLQLGDHDSLSPYELSMFFTIFVMLQFWNMFNARAFESNKSAFHFKGCHGFGIILLLIIIGQIVIVQVGGEFFSVVPLKLNDWIAIIASTSLVLWIGELLRMLTRGQHSI